MPTSVSALIGCWEGDGEVSGKRVAVAVNAYPILDEVMLAAEVVSSAIADPQDQYAAHLVFGGSGPQADGKADEVVGYWADTFGGAFATAGRGTSHADGFEMTYQYPDAAFVNRWVRSGDSLMWQITARGENGLDKIFASYALRKAACQS